MMYDMHMHTTNSDGRNTVEEMCKTAIEKGVSGIAFTDHADMNFYEERNTFERIKVVLEEVGAAEDRYADSLLISCGVELGEYLYNPRNADTILQMAPFDVVLGSVHYLPNGKWDKPYNRIPFDTTGTDEELCEYWKAYLNLLSDTVDSFDFDVLAHLTCPARYMTGKYLRKTDIRLFEDQIRRILEKIIARNIALEFNTAGLGPYLHYYNSQNELLFEWYKSMGGKLITLGSDAHTTAGIGRGFDMVCALLKEYGFEEYHYYKNRKPHAVKL